MSKLIAEIGLNHLGSGKKLVKMVKLLSNQKINGLTIQVQSDNYYDNKKPFRKKIEFKFYRQVSNYLKNKKIKLGLAIVDSKTIDEFQSLKINFWKIISPQFFNKKLIAKALKSNKEVYLSTGIASMNDIKKVSLRHKKIKFIHTSFASSIDKANMLAINKMRETINKNVSFGLHSNLDDLITSAITLKADSVFFYVKFNDKKQYPDGDHAINIENLGLKISKWKKILQSLGSGLKKREKLPGWVFE